LYEGVNPDWIYYNALAPCRPPIGPSWVWYLFPYGQEYGKTDRILRTE
jgi:hypothetical protein